MPQPKLLNKAWASDGLKNSIPDTRSGGMPLEGATYADGFPSITMTPIATGGKPPSGKDMNGILYELSAHIVWQNQGGRYKYDATLANAIGGYSKGCVVLNDAGDTEYISTVDRNKNNPNTNKSGWRVYSSALVNNLTTNDAEKPLTAAMGKKLADEKLGNSGDQTITDGTLTIGRANTWNKIIMPSGRGNWIFEANPAAAEAVADSIRFNFKFEEPGKKAKVLRFHQIGAAGETVAYQSWVAAKAAEAAAGKADTKKLTDEDLNSITTPGLYGQVLNVNATPERNYPTTKAGSLLSLPSAYNSDADLASHQIYIPFDTDEIWRRGKRNGGRWTDWTKITVSPAELEEAVRTAAGQAVLLTGAQTVRGVKTFSDGLKTPTPVATSNDTSVATTEFVRHAVDSSLPSGAVMYFAMQAAPLGWLKADGSAVSRTQYPALFAAIGTTFGVGDGRTTFNLPDLRGEFVRGWDGGRNIDPGRAFGSAQGDAIRNITGSIDTGSNNGHQLFDEATATGALAISQRRWKAWTSDTQDGRNNPSAFDFDASRVVPTAAENRPRNIALLACIKI
nr:MAG TPA: tail fiber protein [Caudoviricetes sp.]